ncbi:MAG: 16S rRNA (guanine(527)-N(7))-methyltransferase RsmG [Spirochaetales bacterium]
MQNLNFKELAKSINIELTDSMINQFETYYSFLVEYNSKTNLTSITEKSDIYIKHFLDSLLGLSLINQNAKICDIGTGAGFPGVPIKIARPDINLVLVDSLNKRVEFLKELVIQLNLDKIEVIHARAEDFAKNNRESFDYAVARAVAPLNTLSEYCLPVVRLGGEFIAYKADNIEEELNSSKNAIKILGGNINKTVKIMLPGTDIIRNFVIIKKTHSAPSKYPRSGNKPRTQPL